MFSPAAFPGQHNTCVSTHVDVLAERLNQEFAEAATRRSLEVAKTARFRPVSAAAWSMLRGLGRGNTMKIAKIEDLHCDAGWRDFSFLKITTDDGHRRLVGIQRRLRQRRPHRRDPPHGGQA